MQSPNPAETSAFWCPECGTALYRSSEAAAARCCELARTRERLKLGWQPRPVPPGGIRVLSLDGGGTRGLLAIEMLKGLEAASGRRVHELFDVIGGTSTGGIIALALQEGFPLARIEVLYRQLALDVFKQQPRHTQYSNLIMTGAKHKATALENILRSLFSEASGEAKAVDDPAADSRAPVPGQPVSDREAATAAAAGLAQSSTPPPPRLNPSPTPLRGWAVLRGRDWQSPSNAPRPSGSPSSAAPVNTPGGAAEASASARAASPPLAEAPEQGPDKAAEPPPRPPSRVSAAALAAATAFREVRARRMAARALTHPDRTAAAIVDGEASTGSLSSPAPASAAAASISGSAADSSVRPAETSRLGMLARRAEQELSYCSEAAAMEVAEAAALAFDATHTGGGGALGVGGSESGQGGELVVGGGADDEGGGGMAAGGAPLTMPSRPPNVFVVATDVSLHPPSLFLFRNYTLPPRPSPAPRSNSPPNSPAHHTPAAPFPPRPRPAGSSDFNAWEAGRATSAAPSFFPPAVFAMPADGPGCSRTFQDGALLANNPAALALAEAKARTYLK